MIPPPALHLLPLGTDPSLEGIVRRLAERFGERLPIPARVLDSLPLSDLLPAAPSARAGTALPSNDLVDALQVRFPWSDDDPVPWILAVVPHDLHAPSRDFVFGEAALGGAWAVLALPRLVLENPPSPADLRRLETEALHELGHLAALNHCRIVACVMSPSLDRAAVDRKSPHFCDRCRPLFEAALAP